MSVKYYHRFHNRFTIDLQDLQDDFFTCLYSPFNRQFVVSNLHSNALMSRSSLSRNYNVSYTDLGLTKNDFNFTGWFLTRRTRRCYATCLLNQNDVFRISLKVRQYFSTRDKSPAQGICVPKSNPFTFLWQGQRITSQFSVTRLFKEDIFNRM